MCVKKQRHLDVDTQGSRFALRAFQRFYALTMNSKKPKSVEEFINSPYYTDFAKFGNHLSNLKPLHIEKFIDYVIMHGIKLKDWTKDEIYYLYIENIIKTEPADSAVERTIKEMSDWSLNNKTEFKDFFYAISANEASHLVRTGRLSPWVLYLSESGGNLLSSFTEDHAKMIGGVINAAHWMKRFKKESDDVVYIRTILEQAGL
jgi:hypothetical protein